MILFVSRRNITNELTTETGTVVEWLKPFKFKVRLDTDEIIICGLEFSYFGRMLPKTAMKRLEKDGPRRGDEVSVLVSENRAGGMRHGIILRNRG